ncbi:hypothetical protein JT219_02425 [Helicobacter pylori]|nr:hypothetical protein [Helicobacter pylori]
MRRAFATFAFHGMLLTMLVCPIMQLWGVMKSYNKPPKTPLDRIKYAWQSFTPQ